MLLQRQHKEESPRLENYDTLPHPFGSSSKSFQPTLHLYYVRYNDSKSKWQIWQTLNKRLEWYMAYVFLFCVKNIFTIHLYVPSICSSVFASFPVQAALGVPTGFRTEWTVHSNQTRIWLLLMNLCHFFEV